MRGKAQAVLPLMTWALTEGWRVEQPAVGIDVVQAARHVERRIRPQVAVVDLAVVAHLRDHLVAEVVVQAQGQAQVARLAQQVLDDRVFAAQEGVDVVGGDAQFFGCLLYTSDAADE